MRRTTTWCAAVLGAMLIAAASAAAASPLKPARCEPGLTKGTMCWTLTVPLDRTGATPGVLKLPVRVLPARGSGPRRGPLLMLAGGPGQAGLNDAATNEVFAQLAPGYDIVSFDQRGTGATALRCKAMAGEDADPETSDDPAAQITEMFAACAGELGPARRFYTSADSAADIDDLRAALGAEQLTIGGTSYGTWVSQVYARMFPRRVKRLILDSVVGPNGLAGIALSEYAAARRILRAMCDNGACRGITSDLLRDTTRLVARLNAKPIRGRVVRRSGRPRTMSAGGPKQPGVVGDLLLAGDLAPALRAVFPAAVASALRGDPALLLRLTAATGDDEADEDQADQLSNALYAATTCAETALPWAGTDAYPLRRMKLDAALAALPAERLGPWGRQGVLTSAAVAGCLHWPDSPFAAPPGGPLPDVPALVLNGLDDVRTPVEDAAAVAAELPRSTLVKVSDQGHSVIAVQECARHALKRFLGARRVAASVCERPSVANLAPVPPRSLSAVGPKGTSRRARARRSIRAARGSVRDAVTFLPVYAGAARYPGLRGGTATLRGAEDDAVLILRRYEYVPGVRISGRLHLEELLRGRLRVRGRKAAHGTLTVHDGSARGRLGGVHVALRLQRGAR